MEKRDGKGIINHLTMNYESENKFFVFIIQIFPFQVDFVVNSHSTILFGTFEKIAEWKCKNSGPSKI